MKKLFSNTTIDKLQKIPSSLWVVILAVSIFVANTIDFLAESEGIVAEFIKIYSEAGVNINPQAFKVLLVIGMVLIATLLFEIVAKWICRAIIRRFSLKTTPVEFVFRIRIVVSILNVVMGIISLIYFLNKEAFLIVKAALEIPITSILFLWFYSAIREQIVPSRVQSTFFTFVARIYFGIHLIVYGFNFISYMFIYEIALSSTEIAQISLQFGMAIVMSIVAYIYAVKLKKSEKIVVVNNKVDDNPYSFTILEPEEKKDDKIFKDFDI